MRELQPRPYGLKREATFRGLALICGLILVMQYVDANGSVSYLHYHPNCDIPFTDTQPSINCNGQRYLVDQSNYFSHDGTIKELMTHCRQVMSANNYDYFVGSGLGRCTPSGNTRCQPYKTCMITMEVADSIGTGHIDLITHVLVLSRSYLDTYGKRQVIQNVAVEKNAMMRICPQTVHTTEYYTVNNSKSCTYIYRNGDVPAITRMMYTGKAVDMGITDHLDLVTGTSALVRVNGGLEALEEWAEEKVMESERERVNMLERNQSQIATNQTSMEGRLMVLETRAIAQGLITTTGGTTTTTEAMTVCGVKDCSNLMVYFFHGNGRLIIIVTAVIELGMLLLTLVAVVVRIIVQTVRNRQSTAERQAPEMEYDL